MTETPITHDYYSNFQLIGKLIGANMNVTTDNIIPIKAQAQIGHYKIESILVTNPSTSLTTAVGGVYTAAAKGGTALVANTQVYSALTAAAKFVQLTLANSALTDLLALTNLYLNLTTAQGAPATADIYVFAKLLIGR